MSMNNNSYYVLKDYYWPLNTNKGNLLACSISKDHQMLQHYQLLVEILFLLVFRRKDLCEAKHDVVCLKFCSKLDNFGGGVNHTDDLRGKASLVIGGVNCTDDLG